MRIHDDNASASYSDFLQNFGEIQEVLGKARQDGVANLAIDGQRYNSGNQAYDTPSQD